MGGEEEKYFLESEWRFVKNTKTKKVEKSRKQGKRIM